MWAELMRAHLLSADHPGFAGFEAWLRLNGFSHYLAIGSGRHPDTDAEAWFSDELHQIGRTKGAKGSSPTIA